MLVAQKHIHLSQGGIIQHPDCTFLLPSPPRVTPRLPSGTGLALGFLPLLPSIQLARGSHARRRAGSQGHCCPDLPGQRK